MMCSRCHRKIYDAKLVTVVGQASAARGAVVLGVDDTCLVFCNVCVSEKLSDSQADLVHALITEEMDGNTD